MPLFEEYNTHPPTSTLIALPFAWLDYRNAHLAWNLLSLAAFVISLVLIFRELSVDFPNWGWFVTAGLLMVCDPFLQTILQGQINLVLLLLLTAAWSADRRDLPFWTGAFVGLATCLKLFPGLLFPVYAARGQWKTFLWGVIWGLIWIGVTAAVFGPQTYLDYLSGPIHELAPFRNHWGNVSLSAFWARLFGPSTAQIQPLQVSPALQYVGLGISGVAVLAINADFSATKRKCGTA